MRLVVRLPRFSPAVDEVRLGTWAKTPGDVVTYGEALCDVVVQEVTRMRRPLSALAKTQRTTEYGKIGVQVQYRIAALDAGILSTILVEEGDTVAVGDDIAVLESDGGSGEAAARVVVNLVVDQGNEQ